MTKNHTASRVQGKFSIFFTAKCNMADNGALRQDTGFPKRAKGQHRHILNK